MDYEKEARDIAQEFRMTLSDKGYKHFATILRAHFEPKAEPRQDAKALARKIVIDYIDDDAYPNAEEEIAALLASRPADAALSERIQKADTYLAEVERAAKANKGYISSSNMLGLVQNARAALASSPREDDRLARIIVNSNAWKAPCPICGYNGPGWYQPSTHSCAALREDDKEEAE